MLAISEKNSYNIKEGAEYLGVSITTFRKLLSSGAIKYAKLTRRLIIPKASLENYLDSITNGTASNY